MENKLRHATHQHRKKAVAPAVITGLLVLYELGFAVFCAAFPGIPLWVKLVGGIVPLALAGVCIYVLIERIKEIRSGEEDDLGQY